MAEELKEHGVKIALGLGGIVMTYVLYTCVMSEVPAEAVKEAEAVVVKVEEVAKPLIAEVETQVAEKIEVAETVVIEDNTPEVVEESKEDLAAKEAAAEEAAAKAAKAEEKRQKRAKALMRKAIMDRLDIAASELNYAALVDSVAAAYAECARI
jgi:hypothetical protein